MFQKSVLQSVPQNESLIAQRWAEFQKYLAKIDFIKSVKEEKYQDGFLKDIFENCLGYTLDSTNPNEFNLEREKKNETDGKKADGVIYVNKEVVGIIELKAQDTKNLDKIEAQAFNYHNSHSNSKYIIISNFDELRFYIDKKTAYEKFSLFTLNYEDFKKLHLLLSYESIKNNIPLKLKEKTANFEKEISKNLYRDFSLFRTHLFQNLVKNNDLDKSLLLRLTQKLCDRIIFILFAEDRGLLNPNTIKEIRDRHKNDGFGDRSMYDYYKLYFDAINKGNEKLNIPKYNGGLFAEDTQLDSLKIDDDYLDMETQKLSDYDFESDVSVNILGHIFEQSLTDLEEINASIENIDFDKAKTKRKKDGVFYTPEYITKYIVENTLGKLCDEKKEELKIIENFYVSNAKSLTKKEQVYKEILLQYRTWLDGLKIIDPACGSGAFLNQALEFLIKEHTNVRDMLLPFADLTIGYEIEKSILENNLYGVDINEDAVEIARLSLWLRTAHKGRELTTLADKIVCANSLLDMPFEEGIFDVVIGNPPYVRHEMIKELKPQLKEKYETFVGTADLFVYFYELGIRMLKQSGLKGYICSNKFFMAKYGERLREYILTNTTIEKIVDFNGIKVFEDATVDSAITIFKKEFPNKNTTFKVVDTDLLHSFEMEQSDLNKAGFSFVLIEELALKKKFEKIGIPLKEWNIKINRGILTGLNEAFIIDSVKKDELVKRDKNNIKIIKPLFRGRDIKRYSYDFDNKWLINVHNNPPVDIQKYPVIKEYLDFYYDKLLKRTDKGTSPYNLRNCAYLNDFDTDKIIYAETMRVHKNNNLSRFPRFSFDSNQYYADKTCYFITGENLKYILSILNSKVGEYMIYSYFNKLDTGGFNMQSVFIKELPIAKIKEEYQQPFIKLVDEILEAKQKIKDYKHLLNEATSSNNFDREIKLKKELEILENRIKECENEIDKMVYGLYELNDNEIKIIETI